MAMAGCGLLGSLCSLFVGRRFRLMLPCVWGPVLLTSPSFSQAVEFLASFLTLSHAIVCMSTALLYVRKEGVFCSLERVDSL